VQKKKKTSKSAMMTSYVWHCFCTYCTKKQVFITFQHYHVTQRLSGTTRVGSKTKSIRPRPRPRPVWDRSCHKTAVSDPKTASNSHCRWLGNVVVRASDLWSTDCELYSRPCSVGL